MVGRGGLRRVGLALVGTLLAAGCAGAPAGPVGGDREVTLDFEQYTLANGLRVVLRRDTRLPIAAVNLWYHVGPANEVKGRTGFAHLFEHMMFQGSGHIPEGQADKLLDAAGATHTNATTGFDRTNFFETVPSNALELALWSESDKMGFLLDALDQDQLSNQQSVVRNERRERYEVPPYGLVNDTLFAQLFPPGHPYAANVIGSHADIQSAQLADVKAFFKQYYVPNNASLAIVGDIDVEATKKLIEKYFGSLPRGADVPSPQVDTPPLPAEKRVTLTDQVQLPRVTMAWLTPKFYAPGDAEADVAAHVLAGGKASRLYEALVRGTQIAQDVSGYQQSMALGSVFQLEATAKPGHTAQELEAAIQRELDALKAQGPRPDELEAAKTAIRSDLLFSLEDPAGVADDFNQYLQYTGDPGYLEKDLRRYAEVRADAVQKFAADDLRNDRRVVIYTVPGPKVIPPEPPTPPQPPADTTPKPPSAQPWRNAVPQPGPAPTAALPTAQRFQLANGLTVYLTESHAIPLAVASLRTRRGAAADPPAQPGLASFAVGMLDEGTTTRDSLGIAREVDSLGAKLESGVTDDGASVTVSSLIPKLGQAMGVLSDVVRNPSFPATEIERVRRQQQVSLRQEADDPDTVADKVMRREVFGATHPYGHTSSGTSQSLATISRDDLVRFHQQAFSPRDCALVLAGDLTPDQARTIAEDAFGSWTGTASDSAPPGPPTPGPQRVLMVDRPGSAQSSVLLAQPGVSRGDPDYEPMLVLNEVLGGGFSSRVNLNLRERHGYTYGAFSALGRNRGVSSVKVSASVQTQFTGPSVREMLTEVNGLRDAPIPADELDRAKQAIIKSLPGSFVTASASAAAVGRLYEFDLPPDYYRSLPDRVAKIDAAQTQDMARKHLDPAQMKVIAVGDRSRIEPQLAELNLGPVAQRTPEGAPAP